MVTLFTLGFAGPLDGLAPLPSCTPDAGMQQALPFHVFDMAFDGEGRLWVADWGGLSIRDEALAAVDTPAPGSHGWAALVEQEDGSIVADHAFDVAWPAVPLKGDVSVSRMMLDAEFYGYGSGRIRSQREAEGLKITSNGIEKDGKTWMAWPERPLDDWGRPESRRVERLLGGPLTGNSHEAPLALEVHDDGRFATATKETLRLHAPDGAITAEVPVIRHTDAAGIVRDRLFTVSGGELRVWSADSARSWVAPGTWIGAVTLDDDLLVSDGHGQLWHLDLDDASLERRACLVDSCEPPVGPLPRPPTRGAPEELGPRAMQWLDALTDWSAEHPLSPVSLTMVHDKLVVSHLDPKLWTEGLHAVIGLSVTDAEGRAVEAHTDRPDARIGSIHPGPPGTVVFVREPLTGDAEAYALADLAEVSSARAQGPAVRFSEFSRDGSLVEVGAYEEGRFSPAQGLPPRHAMQQRTSAYGVFAGERFVISAHTRSMSTPVPAGNTEVWCTPPMDGAPATVIPGVLSMSSRRPRDPRKTLQDTVREHQKRSPGLITGGRHVPWMAEATRKPTWVWADDGANLDTVLALELRKPLLIQSAGPAPESLPRKVTWEQTRSALRTGEIGLFENGIVVWSGLPGAWDPMLDRADKRAPTATEPVVEKWTERNAKAPTEPPEPNVLELFEQALAAGRLDEARQLANTHRLPMSHEVQNQLWAGTPLPEDRIEWIRRPDGDTFLLQLNPNVRSLWVLADATGLPGAMLQLGAKLRTHDHPGLGLARWTSDEPFRVGMGYVLVHQGTMVRIFSTSATPEEVREVVEAR